MLKFLNSPIAITIILITAAAILFNAVQYCVAKSIRNVYIELNEIAQDASTDAEKTQAVRDFSKSLAENIKAGFSDGFGKQDTTDKKLKAWLDVKDNVIIDNIKSIESQWPDRDMYIFTIENKSKDYISQIKAKIEYHKNGEVIAIEDKWLSSIKVLEPGQKFYFDSYRRVKRPSQNEPAPDELMSDEIKIYITDFSIKKIE